MKKVSIFVEANDLTETENLALSKLNHSPVSSQGLTGEVVTGGMVITLTIASLKIFRDLIVAYIKRNRTVKMKWKGQEITAASPEDAIRIVNAIRKELERSD